MGLHQVLSQVVPGFLAQCKLQLLVIPAETIAQELGSGSIGKVGNAEHIVIEDEVGPDDANHAPDGIFIMAGPGVSGQGRELTGLNIYDVGPTLLRLFDLSVPADMRGRVIDG